MRSNYYILKDEERELEEKLSVVRGKIKVNK